MRRPVVNIFKHTSILLPLALVACGVKVNGKSYGLGGSSNNSSPSSTSSSSSSASSSSSSSESSTNALAAGDEQCPLANGIADPWAAVDGDHPKVVRNLVRQAEPDVECTAANDHCQRQCMWLQVEEKDEVNRGIETYFDDDLHAWDSFGDPWVAYRTVPATKRLLKPGAIVTFVQYPAKVASGGHGRYSSTWMTGKLDRVDWKAGKVYLVGSRDPGWLSTTRVAVLEYRDGGKVTIAGGLKRDELAVRASDTFAPLADAPIVVDPWAEIGANGEGKAETDDAPLERSGTCTTKTNHCLRSWAWFVDIGGADKVSVARFDGKQFLGYQAVFNASAKTVPLQGVRNAYRTMPATKATLRAGMLVFNRATIGSEEDAHSDWEVAKVVKVEDDDNVRVEDSYGRTPRWSIGTTRIPVLVWLPGDKAEKL
jgi:hypothetical protein